MKIIHIVPTYYPATYWGGPIYSVYGLNNALSEIPGVELKILTTDSAGPKRYQRITLTDQLGQSRSQEIFYCRRISGASVSWELIKKMPSMIRWADVVHLTATYSFPTIPAILMSRYYKKSIVWSPRGAILDAYKWEGTRKRRIKGIWNSLCNILIRRGTVTLHVTSKEEKEASLAAMPRSKAIIIPNGVEIVGNLEKKQWKTGGALRLMFIGRLSPKKGVFPTIKLYS